MLARYGSERQFGNTFRRMANTSFSKIQFVAKVFQEVPSPGLAPLPHHRSTRRHRLWPAKWILALLYYMYIDPNIRQETSNKSPGFNTISSSHLLVLLVFRDQIVHVALSLTKKVITDIGHK